MNNKILIGQLNNLKNIKPDNEWKSNNREILYSQIFNSGNEAKIANFKIFAFPQRIFKFISQPAMVVVFISLIVISGGFFSARAAKNIKPGGSLYIARIISEKAQLAVTFNKEAKNKLGIKFANKHAKDITEILANPEFNVDENKVKIEKLTQDFKKEISTVKDKISKIDIGEAKDNNKDNNEGNNIDSNENVDEVEVFSANLEKEESGLQIFEPRAEIKQGGDNKESAEQENVSTSTIEASQASGGVEEEFNSGNANKIIEEAEELFNSQDYSGTLDKLEKVDDAIDADGEVKGASEEESTASSSLESGD